MLSGFKNLQLLRQDASNKNNLFDRKSVICFEKEQDTHPQQVDFLFGRSVWYMARSAVE